MPTRTTTDLCASCCTTCCSTSGLRLSPVALAEDTLCSYTEIALLACLRSAGQASSAGYRPLRLLSVVDLGAAPALVTLA